MSPGLTINVLRDSCKPYIHIHMTNLATRTSADLITEFAGGESSDVSMMIGIGLIKDSDGVFFEYLGEEQQPRALMLPSGKPLTRMANVRVAGVDIAEDVGEFNSTKLNLILETTAGSRVMLTSGLTTIWSQCVLTSLMGMLKQSLIEEVFQLDSWNGTAKMRPTFAAVRIKGQKISDQEMYELFAGARTNRDNDLKEQLARNCVTQLQAALGVVGVEVTVEATKTEEF